MHPAAERSDGWVRGGRTRRASTFSAYARVTRRSIAPGRPVRDEAAAAILAPVEANVELVRRAVDAYNRRDLDVLASLTTDDFEFVPYLTTLIEKTTYHGHKGWVKYFQEADSAWKQVHVRLDEARQLQGGVMYGSGEITGQGRASGLEVRIPLFWIAAIRDGKLSRMHIFENEADALRAAEAAQRSNA
jgi:ketosteroid isomerase-like protein